MTLARPRYDRLRLHSRGIAVAPCRLARALAWATGLASHVEIRIGQGARDPAGTTSRDVRHVGPDPLAPTLSILA